MSTPFLGQISIFAFNYAPKNFALCNGQLLPINQNQALFSLLGTMYGGDGVRTFALPDFRGRTPIHTSSGFTQGNIGGEENHILTISEMPQHTHIANASTSTTTTVADPTNAYWADPSKGAYTADPADNTMSPAALANVGQSQPHENMSPNLVINFCIALVGIFPSRN